jgi:hypothetical protein
MLLLWQPISDVGGTLFSVYVVLNRYEVKLAIRFLRKL